MKEHTTSFQKILLPGFPDKNGADGCDCSAAVSNAGAVSGQCSDCKAAAFDAA